MPDMSTTYLGLTLRNPIIVGSCTHTISPTKVQKLAEAGAGAVVLKSIFEEQIRANVSGDYAALENETHPEALAYLRADLPVQLGPEQYLNQLKEIKAAVDIPVIASINCTHGEQWTQFAKQVEAVGADALELNIYDVVTDPHQTAQNVEERHLAIVKAVTSSLSIPVAVKLGPFYSSLVNFAGQVVEAGATGLVLFNRFLQPDLNPATCELEFKMHFSRPEDMLLPLRWTAILRRHLECDLSFTTGIHSGQDAAKALLAGATTVQVCSALYNTDPSTTLSTIVSDLQAWMEQNRHDSIDACRGLALKQDDSGTKGFERAQYIKALVGLE